MTESILRTLLLHRRSDLSAPVVAADAGRRVVPTWQLRGALMAGCAIAIGLAGYMGDPSGLTHSDPALARLLRGMALIKAMLAIAIVAAVWWRFGRPAVRLAAAGYLLGSWILAGSTTLVWQLSWIPLAAILFHVAALSMLLVSWRER